MRRATVATIRTSALIGNQAWQQILKFSTCTYFLSQAKLLRLSSHHFKSAATPFLAHNANAGSRPQILELLIRIVRPTGALDSMRLPAEEFTHDQLDFPDLRGTQRELWSCRATQCSRSGHSNKHDPQKAHTRTKWSWRDPRVGTCLTSRLVFTLILSASWSALKNTASMAPALFRRRSRYKNMCT